MEQILEISGRQESPLLRHEKHRTHISLEEKLMKLRLAEATLRHGAYWSRIQRVPQNLLGRRNLDKYFEPRAVANGPIHHGKCKEAENFKYLLAADFVKDSGEEDKYLYRNIESNIKELRECYDEEATKDYGDETLAWMLFLDGCSTLQFICKYNQLEDFEIKIDQVAFAKQDLFLLENQLPYQVFELLMDSSKKSYELRDLIENFLNLHILASEKQSKRDQQSSLEDSQHRPAHLLELLRTKLLRKVPEVVRWERRIKYKDELLHRKCFRNVVELKEAGIHFKPSKSSSLRDMSYTSLFFAGFLRLPAINEDAMSLFVNLIAYEMCPGFANDFGVTSYICFLTSLIDGAEDVKLLRSARVLYNFHGSDEEVAQLFKAIGSDLVANPEIYRRVKAKLQHHFSTKGRIWIAKFCSKHISNPWPIIKVVARSLLFGG